MARLFRVFPSASFATSRDLLWRVGFRRRTPIQDRQQSGSPIQNGRSASTPSNPADTGWPTSVHPLPLTLLTAALATGLILVPGVALAWLLARRSWPGKVLVETLVALPLVIPPVATGVALLWLLGRRGPLGAWAEQTLGLELAFTWKAVVIAGAVAGFPLLVRTSRVAFEAVPLDLEAVARSLGARPFRVFWKVSLPLASRGVVAGVVLAWARALGEFGTTVVVAGMIPGETITLAMDIYRLVQIGDDGAAFRVAGLSVALAAAAVFLGERLRDRGRE